MAATGSRSSSDRRRTVTAGGGAATGGDARGRRCRRVARAAGAAHPGRAGRHRVVTCYLKLEPRDRSRGKYLIKLKNRVREVMQALPRLGLDRRVAGGGRPRPRPGAAVPAGPGQPAARRRASPSSPARAIGLFEAVPLPAVHRSRLAVDRTPAGARAGLGRGRIRPPAHGGGRSDGRAILRGDRLRYAGSCPASARTAPGASGSTATATARGWGEHTYHNRIRHEKQRHYEAIARELFAIDRRHPAHGIVIAGPGPTPARSSRFSTPIWSSGCSAPRGSIPRRPRRRRCTRRRWRCGRRWERASEREQVHEMLGGTRQRMGRERDRRHAARAVAGPGAHAAGQRRRERARLPLPRLGPAGADRARMPR